MKVTVYYDSGTTNSRAYLLGENCELLATAKREVGSKDSALAGSNKVLILALKELYDELLSQTGLSDGDVDAIYASGMITCPSGLHEVPHLTMPLTVEEFISQIVPFYEDTLFNRVINLVPGLRTLGDSIDLVNNMRGEEIESLGVMGEVQRLFGDEPVGLVFPGSHTHTVRVRGNVLEDALSNIGGELYAAIEKDTILGTVLRVRPAHYDADMLSLGVANLHRYGFNRALYIIRAMDLFSRETPERRAAYAEGVILGGLCDSLDEACSTRWKDLHHIAVVAEDPVCEMYCSLLRNCKSDLDIVPLHAVPGSTPALEGMKMILAHH